MDVTCTALSAGLIAYFATPAEPMLTIVAWNAFFAVVNLAQVAHELLRRRAAPGESGGLGT